MPGTIMNVSIKEDAELLQTRLATEGDQKEGIVKEEEGWVVQLSKSQKKNTEKRLKEIEAKKKQAEQERINRIREQEKQERDKQFENKLFRQQILKERALEKRQKRWAYEPDTHARW